VNDAGAVGPVEGVGDLGADAEDLLDGQCAPLQAIGEGFPFEVLHHDVGQPVGLADVVERADMGMAEGGHGPGLPLEPLATLGAVG
jgi:hypothetical protein